MPVHCAECGEELLGSVNRCWRCGHEFESRTGSIDDPPVRRRPISELLAEPLEAVIVDQQAAPSAVVPTAGERWQRRGSPFVIRDESVEQGPAGQPADNVAAVGPVPAQYPTALGAAGGATAAIVLACIGLVLVALFPAIALFLAAIGLGFGVWGLRAPRREPAIAGLILCCIAFSLSAGGLAYQVYLSYFSF